MIVLSQNIVLSPGDSSHPDAPLILADNIVTTANIEADSAEDANPVTNIANPATDLGWVSTGNGEETLTITPGTADELDGIGIASPNFAAAGRAVSIEGDDGGGFDELVAPFVPPDDRPLMFRINRQAWSAIRIRLAAGSAPAACSVVYFGALVTVPRRIYVGHTPISLAREFNVVSPLSQGGKYLGSISTGFTCRSEISIRNLDDAWLRTNLDPIIKTRRPFFWAWRPSSRPTEIGYVWPTSDVKPVNQRSNKMMQISIPIEGEA